MEGDKSLTLFLVTPDLDILCSFNWHMSVAVHVSNKGTKPTPKQQSPKAVAVKKGFPWSLD